MRLETERLILAPFTDAEIEPVIRLGLDAIAMEYFGGPWPREQSVAAIARWQDRLATRGIGMLGARAKSDGRFVGIIGAQWLPFEESFTPAVEIGWRLDRADWGKGFATEGGRAVIEHVTGLGLGDQIVAVIAEENQPSINVARRLGLTYDLSFNHPTVPEGEAYRRHSLYRLRA